MPARLCRPVPVDWGLDDYEPAMIPQEAIARFVDQQKKLLRKTYDKAWETGVGAYEPDADPAQTPTLPKEMAVAGLTGAALLAALRNYPYEPPARPEPIRRAVALAPAFRGLNRMSAELFGLSPGSTVPSLAAPTDLSSWIDQGLARLGGGDSVAWAGEQAGFAEAVNNDGQFLFSWVTVGDLHVCGDCEVLTSYPAMPLSEWPTAPGAGDTECSVGCRCTWDTWGALPADYGYQLNDTQQALSDSLAIRQADALTSLVSDAAYLD